jgi:hypothetical protein
MVFGPERMLTPDQLPQLVDLSSFGFVPTSLATVDSRRFLSGHGFPHLHAARFLTEYFHLLTRCTNFPTVHRSLEGCFGEEDKQNKTRSTYRPSAENSIRVICRK